MKSLLGSLGTTSREVLRVRSQRLDVQGPTNLARARTALATFFRAETVPMDGVEKYGTDSTLFPIVNSLANDVSAVGFHLYAPGETSAPEDRTEIKEGQHPSVDLFLKPNPFQAREEFVEAGQQFIDLVGEVTILVESVGKIPVRLWIIPPDKLMPIKAPIIGAKPGSQFMLGWVYTADSGEQVPLSLEQIIQIKMPNPANMYRGLGPMQAALVDLQTSRFSAEWNRQFFINGASPEGVIQIEDSFSDDEFREFTERWRESHQGITNAHRVAVLENNAQWVPNQMTQRDMQFEELRRLSSDFIRQSFRYPKTMLGSTDSANRAVAEAGEYMYGKWLIAPRAQRWCAALNNRLMPLYGPNPRKLYWDFDAVVGSDEQTEAATVNLRATAALTLNTAGYDAQDVLAVVGLPPMQWTKPQVPLTGGFAGGDEGNATQNAPGTSGSDGSRDRQDDAQPDRSSSGQD